MVTLLTESGEHVVRGAEVSGDALWCEAREAQAATGWEAKPQGLCRGPICVPVPAGREGEFVQGERINLAGLWRHLGQPAVHSARGDVWVLAESARTRSTALASLEAPDFALPDPSGRMHRLSDYRGKKILLVTWASW